MEFTSFLKESPMERTSLLIKQKSGDVTRGYYIKWSNTVYLSVGSIKSQATHWKYM